MNKIIRFKYFALVCCLLHFSVVLFLVIKFKSIVDYYEKLDPGCHNVKLFFIAGMEYGSGLVCFSVLALLCLKLLLKKR
jgi:hypothetical protein